MNFKDLKTRLIMARDIMLKNHEYYNNSTFHINRENYIFRGVLNRNSMIDFELIQPNLNYFKIHPSIALNEVKFTYVVNPSSYPVSEKPRPEEVKTLERFCEILGWEENNINEFKTYLDMYNVKGF